MDQQYCFSNVAMVFTSYGCTGKEWLSVIGCLLLQGLDFYHFFAFRIKHVNRTGDTRIK